MADKRFEDFLGRVSLRKLPNKKYAALIWVSSKTGLTPPPPQEFWNFWGTFVHPNSPNIWALTGVRRTTNFFVIFQPGSGQLLRNLVGFFLAKKLVYDIFV